MAEFPVHELDEILIGGESVTVEFKSDSEKLPDSVIVEEVVALANTKGGLLLIGVEDDGRISGLHSSRIIKTDRQQLQAMIFSKTVPGINVTVKFATEEGRRIAIIMISQAQQIHATSQGKVLRRILNGVGQPATVPFYPHKQRSRLTDLGLLDYSAHVVDGTSLTDLDPLEFERLRQMVVALRGEEILLTLSDEELLKALRLGESRGGTFIPNIACILLLGREHLLDRVVPSHEVRFQVIDEGSAVHVNDVFRKPLLHIINEVESRFVARNNEQEVSIGMVRFPIPDYSREGFREALLNALLHRDYTSKGSIYIQWQADHLLITNPGGFPEGINLNNLLVHEPTPRNPRLAEAFRRVGLVEQTGRGIDKIFAGQLRFGRPAPDYTRSDEKAVRVVLPGGAGSLEFAAIIYEHENSSQRMITLDELMILNQLLFERRIDSDTAGKLIQKGTSHGRAVLERLLENGFIEARGEKRGRVYHLSESIYHRLHDKQAYVRIRTSSPQPNKDLVIEYIKQHGRIKRSMIAELCHLSDTQASRMLKYLLQNEPRFKRVGKGKGTYYVWKED